MTAGVGKRVRGALYVHREAVDLLKADERSRVARASSLAGPVPWNVARLDASAVALLFYPDFDESAFPRLQASARVDLAEGTVRLTQFGESPNPLILHRKELLVRRDHPARERWAAVTRRAQERGLFHKRALIGRQLTWRALLEQAGLNHQGEELR